ncbi:hypothetical protein ABE871_06650 [Enterococcus gilvus]|uniref:hypothetical protein n=1 Tax=Enterococcus gilvus TaxID=160453 RepID=UPI003D6BA32E
MGWRIWRIERRDGGPFLRISACDRRKLPLMSSYMSWWSHSKRVPAPNILQHVKIKEAAQWEVYGSDVFRGKTTLKKEEMKRLLVDELCLKDDQVYVVEANAN